jgi:hypothetical protein
MYTGVRTRRALQPGVELLALESPWPSARYSWQRLAPPRQLRPTNTDLVHGVLVGAHQEADFIGETLRLTYLDSAAHGYPVIVALNAPVGADKAEVARTIRAVEEAHANFAHAPTFIADTGRFSKGTVGLWRQALWTFADAICAHELGVPPDGGKTILLMGDADALGYLPDGDFAHRFVKRRPKRTMVPCSSEAWRTVFVPTYPQTSRAPCGWARD